MLIERQSILLDQQQQRPQATAPSDHAMREAFLLGLALALALHRLRVGNDMQVLQQALRVDQVRQLLDFARRGRLLPHVALIESKCAKAHVNRFSVPFSRPQGDPSCLLVRLGGYGGNARLRAGVGGLDGRCAHGCPFVVVEKSAHWSRLDA